MKQDLGELRNIGPTIRKRLNEVGVHTAADLARVGPVKVYERICANYPNQTIPVCYYLYSLQGALMDLHWDDIPNAIKDDLYAAARGRPRRNKRRR